MTKAARRALPPNAGVTLTELMVTVAILSVGAMACIGSFTYIARGVEVHRTRTLASNLSQEQVEYLKSGNYFAVIPTTAAYSANTTLGTKLSPDVLFDPGYYPPTVVTIGNSRFTRLTYVERVAIAGGAVVWSPPDSLDTGMKRLTVTTIWQLGSNWYQSTLTNLFSSMQLSNSGGFTGTVQDPGGNPIAAADIFAQSDAFFHDFSQANGAYTLSVTPGNFTISASAAGFFKYASTATWTVSPGNIQALNIVMTPMSSGTVSGAVWVNPNLLISQIVASTNTCTNITCSGGTTDVEYVELFNPTTSQINIITPPGFAGPWHSNNVTENIIVNTSVGNGTFAANNDIMGCFGANCVYVSSYVAPGGYYLIANQQNFMTNGVMIQADAYYLGGCSPNCIPNVEYGGVQIQTNPVNVTLDQVCWDGLTGGPPPASLCNGRYIPTDPNCGMNTGVASPACHTSPWLGNQLVRFSSITVLGRGLYGSAYNSGYNARDFFFPISTTPASMGLNYSPFNSSTPPLPVITGTPGYGSVVTANDGLSASTVTWQTAAYGFPYSTFTLVGIATGTWTVEIDSGSAYLSISSVTVTTNTNTPITNATTLPAWLVPGYYNVVLASSTSKGIISGNVASSLGVPLVGITVQGNGNVITDANGNYNMPVTPGAYDTTANPNSTNPWWSSQTLSSVSVALGQINNGNNFVLGGAGKALGYVCSAIVTNPLPKVTVIALDAFGNVVGQNLTGNNGVFTINNLSTGTYTFEPVLDQDQNSVPPTLSGAITAGHSVSIGTFTVTGAFGYISGNVTASGLPITTGALVLATTGAVVTALPPDISSATLLSAPYYMISSQSNGTFNLPVRTSTATATYNLYGWYTTYTGASGTTPTIVKQSASVTVTAGVTSTQNLAW